jgi:hypothetical protein
MAFYQVIQNQSPKFSAQQRFSRTVTAPRE